MKRLLVAWIVLAAGVAHAQPAPTYWRPPLCTDGQGMEFDTSTSRWVCHVFASISDGDKGDVTVSSSGAVWAVDSDTITDAKLRNSAALSVIGRSANSTGDPADIAGTDGQVLRVSGTTLGFGTIPSTSVTGLNTGSGTSGRSTRWSGTNVLADGALTDDGTNATTNGLLVVSAGAVGALTTNGIHLGFTANVGTITASQPGTANRELGVYGHPLKLYGNEILALTISGNDGQFADTLGVTGLLTATAGVTTPANLTTTGTGALVVAGTGTIGGVFDVNNDLSKFGSSDGDIYFSANSINAAYSNNASASWWLNLYGYNGSTAHNRDLYFGDAKGAEACRLTGSTKSLNCIGGLQENSSPVLSGSITGNTIPKGSGGDLVDSGLTDDGSVFDVNRDTTKFGGGGDGYIYFSGDEINAHYATDSDQALFLNRRGYAGAFTRFRTVYVQDGKSNTVATFTGSDKSLAVVGNLSTAANFTAGNAVDIDTHVHNGSTTFNGDSSVDPVFIVTDANLTGETIAAGIIATVAGATTYVGLYGNAPEIAAGCSGFPCEVEGGGTILQSVGVYGNGDLGGVFDNGLLVASGGFGTNDGVGTDLGGYVNLGNDSTDAVTFSNGPAGINTYEGTHLEWSDEWTYRSLASTETAGILYTSISSGAVTSDHGGVGRPGVVQISTASSASGLVNMSTSFAFVDFNNNTTTTFEWVGGFPTLSDGTQSYAALVGFYDTSNINPTDGCYFLYDSEGAQTTPGTGDSDTTSGNWKIMSAENNTRSGYELDGTASEDSFTTVASSVGALTWPSTNVYKLKVVAENDDKCRFYINDVEVGRITTNIPGGSLARSTAAGFSIIKSAGSTARTMDTDFTRLAMDLAAAR